MLRLRRSAAWVTAVVLGCVPASALAQIPLPIPPPGFGGQLPQPSRPAPITLTPAIAVFEEYPAADRSTPIGGAALAADADQNRVSFGLQIGYPLRFD